MASRRRSRSVSPSTARQNLDVMSVRVDSVSLDAVLDANVISDANSNSKETVNIQGTSGPTTLYPGTTLHPGTTPYPGDPSDFFTKHPYPLITDSNLTVDLSAANNNHAIRLHGSKSPITSPITLPNQGLSTDQLSLGLDLTQFPPLPTLSYAVPTLSYAVPTPNTMNYIAPAPRLPLNDVTSIYYPRERPSSDTDSIASIDVNLVDGHIHGDTGEEAITDSSSPYRFLKRGSLTIQMICLPIQRFLGPTINWRTLSHFLVDICSTSFINGDVTDLEAFISAITCLRTTPSNSNLLVNLLQSNSSLNAEKTISNKLREDLQETMTSKNSLKKEWDELYDEFTTLNNDQKKYRLNAEYYFNKATTQLTHIENLERKIKNLELEVSNKEFRIQQQEILLEEKEKEKMQDVKMEPTDNLVSKENYDRLRETNRKITDDNRKLRADNETLKIELEKAEIRKTENTDMDITPPPRSMAPSPPNRLNPLPSTLSSPPPSKKNASQQSSKRHSLPPTSTMDFNTTTFLKNFEELKKGFPDFPINTITELAAMATKLDKGKSKQENPTSYSNMVKATIGVIAERKQQPWTTVNKRQRPTYQTDNRVTDTDARATHNPFAQHNWREIETNKSIVSRPTTLGTRVSDLYILPPRSSVIDNLRNLSGKVLIDEFSKLIIPKFNKEDGMLFDENRIIAVKWTAKGSLVISCHKGITDKMKKALIDGIASLTPDLSQYSIQILNKPPTTELKFEKVRTRHDDDKLVSAEELIEQLKLGKGWANVEIWGNPRFVYNRALPLPEYCLLTVSVVDNDKGDVGKRLMNTNVPFWGIWRTCFRWVNRRSIPRCTQCQQWGHMANLCRTNALICAKCGEYHLTSQHEKLCTACKEGRVCPPRCYNCFQPHTADSKECPFFKARYSHDKIQMLRAKRSRRVQELRAAEAKEGNNKKRKEGPLLPKATPPSKSIRKETRSIFAQASAMGFNDMSLDRSATHSPTNPPSRLPSPHVSWENDDAAIKNLIINPPTDV